MTEEKKMNPGRSGLSKVFIITATFLSPCLIIFTVCYYTLVASAVRSPPHIVFIFVDDMGWNDVSFHGSPQIPTPNIDALAAGGIILNNYYVLPQCTPSRAALLSGRYPFRMGMQHQVIRATEPYGLPLDVTILPQYLKKLGYATHLVGKWHLGYYKRDFLPTRRGFDSFFGYWNGVIDYYDYTHYVNSKITNSTELWGVDIRDNEELVTNARGKYATELFTEKAANIITEHNTSQPLFLYMSHLATHTSNSYMPLQAPPEHVAKFKHIEDMNRRIYAGVMSSLDDSVGKIFQALHSKGMLDNSVVVFSSDNGGAGAGQRGGAASNWPLRGLKLDLWEGGVRAAAAIWSPLLKLTDPRTSLQMMHVTDWLPTFYHLAGGHTDDLAGIDGINMWEYLAENTPSPREEILLNIDPIFDMAALRKGDMKLLLGSYPKSRNSWYGPTGREEMETSSTDSWVWRNGSVVKDILVETNRWLLRQPDTWRKEAEILCKDAPASVNQTCDPVKKPCLFNITEDPCEHWDLAKKYPQIVSSMMERIRQLNETAVAPLSTEFDMRGDPRCHGFAFVPWLDEKIVDCPWL